ncbi:hypothetical protein KMW28_09380 [Flammeovirga yaeyamensis]|uniref:RHS repeat-associated core domain-containing protein n=1 Tax=Flammeovirga yaeyamensis TaxID=367791 RepID=A0AAX1NDK2_9BACT|nr:RHS repeat-associated core domain-containing protein [Flammeovirga yaeyamensis]MBB3698829.1 RHS repeat-associated protein [Flammeovirga yaeyamensis]NMF37414.1 hypothetical protein [Flammeovirga yaeyamensis]QWG03773.1 hypothetical protein KMW28_09380 [Flammeovirga yaeyamensis]
MSIVKDGNISELPIYGSNRLGQYETSDLVPRSSSTLGQRRFEFSNHLGNVLVTMSDEGDILSYSDYYPFGLNIESRSWRKEGYRYGFNGKENDADLSSSQLIQDYGFRVYNPVIGKFLSVDPLAMSFPWNSTYAFAENDVIRSIDLEGGEKLIVTPSSKAIYNKFIKIIKSDKILKERVYDPISKPELKDKIHIYLLTTRHFGSGLGIGGADGRHIKGSEAKEMSLSIDDYDSGNWRDHDSYEINADRKMLSQAGLTDKNNKGKDILKKTLVSKQKQNIQTPLVLVYSRPLTEYDQMESILHELYIHAKYFEESDNEKDHIREFSEKFYKNNNLPPRLSPGSIDELPNDNDYKKLWNRFKKKLDEYNKENTDN